MWVCTTCSWWWIYDMHTNVISTQKGTPLSRHLSILIGNLSIWLSSWTQSMANRGSHKVQHISIYLPSINLRWLIPVMTGSHSTPLLLAILLPMLSQYPERKLSIQSQYPAWKLWFLQYLTQTNYNFKKYNGLEASLTGKILVIHTIFKIQYCW